MTEYCLVDKQNHIMTVTLNRPDRLNALHPPANAELGEVFDDFAADDDMWVAIITGEGRGFSAGNDLRYQAEGGERVPTPRGFGGLSSRFDMSKPVIAAVSGWALGGGNELAMSCDMIIASETAKFGQPEINLGVIPGAGGTQRLTKAVGKAIAMEMVLNDRTLDAQEALAFGLVNQVLPVERYLDAALELAAQIAARAPLALRMGKEAVNRSFETHLSDGIAEERQSFYFLFSSEDQKEGMRAFGEKRKAKWKGK